jgi:hypothetical protein
MLNNLKGKGSEKLSKEEVYDFLHGYLEEQLSLVQRQAMSEESFTKPAWAEYQAFLLGQQKAFSKLIELIPLTKGK